MFAAASAISTPAPNVRPTALEAHSAQDQLVAYLVGRAAKQDCPRLVAFGGNPVPKRFPFEGKPQSPEGATISGTCDFGGEAATG
jgi:hypothetical protein